MVKIKIDCQLTHSKHEGKCYRQDKRTLLTTGKSAKAKDSYSPYTTYHTSISVCIHVTQIIQAMFENFKNKTRHAYWMFTQFTCSKNIFFKIFWKWNVNVIVNDAQSLKERLCSASHTAAWQARGYKLFCFSKNILRRLFEFLGTVLGLLKMDYS